MTYQLKALEELQFDVNPTSECTLVLKDGSAEIFGSELLSNTTYKFKVKRVTVFTTQGATIEISKEAKNAKVSRNNVTIQHHNLSEEIEKERENSNPRIMIAGVVDTGKSTLSKVRNINLIN
jgi:polynucleotide 5'-kinase involved in rRNA processing